MNSDGPEEYVVEEIREWRWNIQERCREFWIKWMNYSEDDNTWEPEDNLNCPNILNRFIKSLDPHQLKCFNSTSPERLNGFQRRARFLRVVGADGPHESDDESSDKVDKQKFYCLLQFDDEDVAEEHTCNQFYKYMPDEVLKFFESRIIIRKH